MITCYTCKIKKPENEFYWKIKNVKRNGVCKDCHKIYRKQHYEANRQKYIDKARTWESSHGGKRFLIYGLTKEAEAELFGRFDGFCWICKKKPAAVIDHDHSHCVGKYKACPECIRGALCSSCNTGIALLGDSVDGLQNALNYLLYYKH